MYPRVKDVKPNPDYTLTLTFINGEVKVFDVKPYLEKGTFRELRDKSLFEEKYAGFKRMPLVLRQRSFGVR